MSTVAVGLYLGLRAHFGVETLSWMCILGAAPFAALGFITWHGMAAEKFVWAFRESEIFMPKRLTFRATNIYYEALKPAIEHPNASGKPLLDTIINKLSAVLTVRKEKHHD
ncbi:MAG: PrgI family protein [Ethanoligenens sp.]